ncbi:MAG TPA: VCBS repeat-containing protein, partial [Chryseosolibacter sp.]
MEEPPGSRYFRKEMGSSGTVASMLIRLLNRFTACWALLISLSCGQHPSSHEEMIQLLHDAREKYNHFDNYYASAARVRHFDSVVANASSEQDKMIYTYDLARALVSLGREPEAILLLEEEVRKIDREGIQGMTKLKALMALAHLRDGERNNCITNHSAETCILPIRGSGIHENESGSRNAIRIYQELLRTYPDNLEYRWLMNIAFMTVGEYPAGVPVQYLVPGLDAQPVLADSAIVVKPFYDVAGALGLQVNNMAGGSIIDDFDNDGYLDIVTSGWDLDDEMHFFHNNADGRF